MKALLPAIALFLTANQAEARIDARFMGFIGMIGITDRVMGEITDDDPQRLYALLNITPKETPQGLGKTIQLEGKKFTLTCAEQGGGKQTSCTAVIKAGAQGTVNQAQGVIRFVALGQEAKEIHQKFFPDSQTGQVNYLSADETFRISSDGSTFVTEYKRNP